VDNWHIKQRNAFDKICKSEWHYADIGACQGEVLSYFYDKLNFGHAFEPDLTNHNFLYQKYIATQRGFFSKLKLNNCAVGNIDGNVKFFTAESHVGNIIGHDMNYRPYQNHVEVACVKLDTYFSDTKVDIIKVDVEGAEWDLFEGAQNLLKTKDILWQVEFHLDEDWHRREILFENGYSIYDLDFRKLSKDDTRPYQAILSKGDL
jgi:FkbM family methyltransferase